jgi:holo-[acyl-carrier protein] synthase
MILGVGIDIIEVDRVIKKMDQTVGFKEKVFSAREITFCETKPNKGENYAARFAAKEAFLKATGFGLSLGYQLSEIEVINDGAGRPSFKLHGDFEKKAIENNWSKIHLSISHLKTVACAVAIIEQ